MLVLTESIVDELTAMAYDAYPYEGCGLLAGPAPTEDGEITVERFYRCRNAAASARVYTVDPLDHLRAERDAETHRWEVLGVVHSHTHSEPYPSATDVARAPDPGWVYTIVSLRRESPEVRTYRIADGDVTELSMRIR